MAAWSVALQYDSKSGVSLASLLKASPLVQYGKEQEKSKMEDGWVGHIVNFQVVTGSLSLGLIPTKPGPLKVTYLT